MRPEGLRQSDRVSFRMPVEASWANGSGAETKQKAETMLVSRNGGVLRLKDKLFTGQELTIRRQREGDHWKTARARIVAEIDQDGDGYLYAIAILDPRADFWDIDFPTPQSAPEALARLLMECSFCQRREVVYLNEPEVKSFEVRKCVARVCTHCDSPSIWIEAQQESASEAGAASNGRRARVPAAESDARKGAGFGVHSAAGIRGEVAVCEDLSKGGLSFRSRNQYEEGSRVEVAVPFTPGSAAIFVPIRIVFSQAIPSAGLYRHGAAYLRPPNEAGI